MRQRCRLLLVDFFSRHCKPCREALPALARLQRRYARQGLCTVVVAEPAPDSDLERAQRSTAALLAAAKIDLPVAWDKYGLVAKRYGVLKKDGLELPRLFLLDTQGALLATLRDKRATRKAVVAFLSRVRRGGAEGR